MTSRSTSLRLGLLVAMTCVAHAPALGAGFIWDDDDYLTENPLLADLAGLLQIWIPGNTPQYYPAVFTTFWCEHALWGLAPLGYHAVNILLHALGAVLAWRLFAALRVPGAWWIGALFALHPVHVESVAWITERKNVLSGVFYLLAALAYRRFEELRESAPGGRAWRCYAAALVLFVLALLAKTVTCSLPAALVLMFLWQRKPLTGARLAPLVPLFAVGLLLALHTAELERTQVGATGADFAFSLGERLLIAGHALLFYPSKLLVPVPLIFFYPRWQLAPGELLAYWPWLLLLVTAGAAALAYRRGVRGPALALALFAGTLVPALGFFDVYPMRYSFVADHFQYLASLGVLALVGSAGTTWIRRPAVRRGLGAAVLLVLGSLTWRQAAMYADAETLWRTTIERNPRAWIAYNNLAALETERGDHTAALDLLQQTLARVDSRKAALQIRFNLGLALDKLGRFDEALREYRLVLEQHDALLARGDEPRLARSRRAVEFKVARSLERLGRDDEAEQAYRRGLSGPSRQILLVPFGQHLLRRGRAAAAVAPLAEYLHGEPTDIAASMLLADALALSGQLEAAIERARQVLQMVAPRGDDPRSAPIRQRLQEYEAALRAPR